MAKRAGDGLYKTMKKDWSNYRLVAVLPLLAVVILFATYMKVTNVFFCKQRECKDAFSAIMWNVLDIDSAASDSKEKAKPDAVKTLKASTALKNTGLMTWSFLGMVYLFVCLATLAASSLVTFQMLQRPVVCTVIVIILSLSVGIVLLFHKEWHMPIFMALFPNTIAKDVPAIEKITNFLNCLGNTAALSILLTSCATLLPPYKHSFPQGLQQLSRRMKYLRIVLYVGTLLLIVAVLLKKAIYQWSLAYTSQEPGLTKIASDFLSSILAIEGGFYTLVLVAVYLPAAVVLQRRARVLDALPVEESEREKKLQQYGLSFSFTESLPRILAILGPTLVGPVGELLSRV
jgi:hypothetical protein